MYFNWSKVQNESAFIEKQLIVVPDTFNEIKNKIFLMRSRKVMRAGTGNKIFFYMALT